METVEKWLQPLIRLAFWGWINCGEVSFAIHTPVEKIPIPLYIRHRPRRFLPLRVAYHA